MASITSRWSCSASTCPRVGRLVGSSPLIVKYCGVRGNSYRYIVNAFWNWFESLGRLQSAGEASLLLQWYCVMKGEPGLGFNMGRHLKGFYSGGIQSKKKHSGSDVRRDE